MNKPIQSGTGLRLSCLGQLRLQDQVGNELTPRTRKARALLAVLALSGRPWSRERLADLFWSDRGAEQARSSFRQAIFELRHLDHAGASVTSPVRDTVCLNAELITTDLWAIRAAADGNDYAGLEALLRSSDAGLLTDLDGLDAELDAWLQVERAHEPSRTLAAAVAAAERCMEQLGPHAATGIVAEVQRLDPSSEEAARLAMRIAHQQGDGGSLHRHFHILRERLRADFDAEPSRETQELFSELTAIQADADAPGPALPGPPGALIAVKAVSASGALSSNAPLRAAAFSQWRVPLLVFALFALLGTSWWLLKSPAPAAQAPLVAVLPFRQQPAGDDFLAEGLWDDTRAALSQHRTVRVLGRATTQAMADARAAPKAYRDRFGVAYLLDGSVRYNGQRVRVTVALTRTSDGVNIWDATFQGRLGDPLALQEAVAQGIEGRLRGRLARGGGKRPEQIATSAEVYALYSEARALLRERELNGAKRATELLRRALAMDPNFAPAWASLGEALYFSDEGPVSAGEMKAESVAAVRRALALAPNLAEAHAALGLIGGDSSTSTGRALERAVMLDPGNAEAWHWLGNIHGQQYRSVEALEAYRHAVEIDPLWFPAVHNLTWTLTELGDQAAVDRLIAKTAEVGGKRELIVTMRAENALVRGDYSAALAPLLALRRERPRRPFNSAMIAAWEGLFRLGYADEAARIAQFPEWFGPVLRSERPPPNRVEGKLVTPEEFWGTQFFSSFASRAMLNFGRDRQLLDTYRRGFRGKEDFISELGRNGELEKLAPYVAVALRSSGNGSEADYLLSSAASRLEGARVNAPRNRELLWKLATIRAAQGHHEEALRLMAEAIDRGWLPDGQWYALDIAQEPSLRALRGDPRFKALRSRILAHIARERAELGPLKL